MGQIIESSEELMILEFRTPQHPSSSSLGINNNNWGGASPLLARNVPKESLEQKYTRLNNTRTVDGIFTYPDDYYYHDDDDEQSHLHSSYCLYSDWSHQQISASDYEPSKGSKRGRIKLLFHKLLFSRKKEKTVTLGGWNTKRRFRLWRIPTLSWKHCLVGSERGNFVSDGLWGSSATGNSWTATKTANRVAEEAGWKRLLQGKLVGVVVSVFV
ncbi:hypothetical protein PIB30_011684 [Stylosanthes scabra]|uniref:Uncharacterized protein n=1 Tax=Stylosanthes scabra TaxID=79078 RepID=A0ABU6X385_9FABA|nr:hypothetical protein [Stylosanthes scabra]